MNKPDLEKYENENIIPLKSGMLFCLPDLGPTGPPPSRKEDNWFIAFPSSETKLSRNKRKAVIVSNRIPLLFLKFERIKTQWQAGLPGRQDALRIFFLHQNKKLFIDLDYDSVAQGTIAIWPAEQYYKTHRK